MSPDLVALLTAMDLDQVLDARGKIVAIYADDEAAVRTVLKEWRDPQAVSNLLFHPDFIPSDIRLETLSQALAERGVVYCNLASVVGLQGLDPAGFSDADRQGMLWNCRRSFATRRAYSLDGRRCHSTPSQVWRTPRNTSH